MNTLSKIQAEIKAPKGQMNKFGGYKYRSCEDIVEAAKPVLNKYGYSLTLSDEIVNIGNRFYVKATATILNNEEGLVYTATSFAREEETKKGMDGSQITGAASSYARKYALNGLFAIDDTKDADALNNHEESKVAMGDKKALTQLVYTSTLIDEEKSKALAAIENCNDYTTYSKIEARLQERQQSFDTITNPNKTDINNHLRKTVKA